MNHKIFSYYQNFKVFFTFLLFWIGIQFGEIIEDSIAFFLVITVGVIHGANDLLILSKTDLNRKKIFFKNLLIYLFLISLCVSFFFFNAFLAIIMFIVISSYHFGEEHNSNKIRTRNKLDKLYYINYGLIIFGMLFYNSKPQLKTIMVDLTGTYLNSNIIKTTLIVNIIIFILLHIYFKLNKKILLKETLEEVFYIMFLFLVFKTTSLIFGFAIYFILWHSLPSILNQVLFLSGEVNKTTLLKFIKKAFLYWLISASSILILYIFTPNIKLFSSSLFVILFSVTVPHMWVMSRMKFI